MSATMKNLLKYFLALSGMMAAFVSAQLPSSTNGLFPSPFYFYNPATLSTQKAATAANPITHHDIAYHDYPTPALLGSHVVFLTTCLKELKESNQKLVTSKLLEEVKNTSSSITVENFKKELAGNTQRLEELAKQHSKTTKDLTEANVVIGNLKNELNVVKQDVESKIGNLKTEVTKSTSSSSIGKIPASCGDLQQIGHRKSGLFSIMGSNKIETVYCDFTKLSNDSALQKWIGYEDVKSLPTFFYVQRTSPFSTVGVPIPFETERLNIGGAMNGKTGKFTAPRKGVYFFSFNGVAVIAPAGHGYLDLDLMVNGNPVARAECDSRTGNNEWETLSLHSTIELRAGDQVWMQIALLQSSFLQDSSSHFGHFNGWLLQEDFSQ